MSDLGSSPSPQAHGELPPSPRVGLVLLLAMGLGLLGSAVAFGRVNGGSLDAPPLTGAEEFAVALPLLIAMGGGALVAAGIDGGRPMSVLGLHGLDRRSVPIGLAAGVLLQAVVVLVQIAVIDPIFGADTSSSAEDLVDAFSGRGAQALLVLLVVVLAPVAEELFYRGMLIPLAMRRWSARWSVAIVAGLFAALHLDPRQLPGLLLVGLGLGALRVWRSTVAAPVAAHVAFNAAGLAALAIDLPF